MPSPPWTQASVSSWGWSGDGGQLALRDPWGVARPGASAPWPASLLSLEATSPSGSDQPNRLVSSRSSPHWNGCQWASPLHQGFRPARSLPERQVSGVGLHLRLPCPSRGWSARVHRTPGSWAVASNLSGESCLRQWPSGLTATLTRPGWAGALGCGLQGCGDRCGLPCTVVQDAHKPGEPC